MKRALALLFGIIAIGCTLLATWTVAGWTTPQRLMATAGVAALLAFFTSLASMEE